MKTFNTKYEANVWHRVFAFLPHRITTSHVEKDTRVVESAFYFLCFVERRFSVIKGIYTGVEYRAIAKTDHERCPVNCGIPGCEAPIGLDLQKLKKLIK